MPKPLAFNIFHVSQPKYAAVDKKIAVITKLIIVFTVRSLEIIPCLSISFLHPYIKPQRNVKPVKRTQGAKKNEQCIDVNLLVDESGFE